MVKSKTKRKVTKNRKNSKYSKSMHNSKYHCSIGASAETAKKVILGIILVLAIAVAGGLLSTLIFNPESQVKNRISKMATDYYENYYYEKLVKSAAFQDKKNIDTNMKEYHEDGFSPITLRDLLLYDDGKNYEYRDELIKYCDENRTAVKFYIDSPYDKTSYHYEIAYACNF